MSSITIENYALRAKSARQAWPIIGGVVGGIAGVGLAEYAKHALEWQIEPGLEFTAIIIGIFVGYLVGATGGNRRAKAIERTFSPSDSSEG
jgi:hypothetical protein